MHAEEGKACRNTACEHFAKEVKTPARSTGAVKVVKRKPKDTKDAKAAKPEPTQPRRTTKKSTLKKPKKWGGRSGS